MSFTCHAGVRDELTMTTAMPDVLVDFIIFYK